PAVDQFAFRSMPLGGFLLGRRCTLNRPYPDIAKAVAELPPHHPVIGGHGSVRRSAHGFLPHRHGWSPEACKFYLQFAAIDQFNSIKTPALAAVEQNRATSHIPDRREPHVARTGERKM